MIYSLTGEVRSKGNNFALIENGGVGFKVFMPPQTLGKLVSGERVSIFCFFYLREDTAELYGFLSEEERGFFELLNSVSGVGPKTALGVMSVDKVENIMTAIVEGKPELLTRVSGIGRKTAERLILELKNKIKDFSKARPSQEVEADLDLEEALQGLGYDKGRIREAIERIPADVRGLEQRLKAVFKILGRG